jgi:thermitase
VPRSRLITLLASLCLLAGSVAIPPPAAGNAVTVRIVVTFRPGTPEPDAMAAESVGTEVERIDQLHVRVVEVPAVAAPHVMAAFAHNPHVERVEVDGTLAATFVPPDPLWSNQWEQRQVRANRAWNYERGNWQTVIAVVDTGVQLTHPDLEDRLVEGYDFIHHDRRPGDDNGHGTSVAGIIAATANSIGISGMCAKCKIMPLKALDAKGNGFWTIAAKAIIWAADHRADVINLSFGGAAGSSTLADAITYARSKGAVVVGAAGNFGSQSLFYPAAYPGVISVASTDPMDIQYSWSDFSTSWVDVAAPGCTWATERGSSYGSFCGTSAATPVVSGIAALLDASRRGITHGEIEDLLLHSTIHTPYDFTRLGRVDAYRAVYRAIKGVLPDGGELRPSAPLLTPPADVTLVDGNHEGYRFDGNGAIVRGDAATLATDTAVHTSKRTMIPGRSGHWLYLVDGPLSGYWVQESSDAFLTPPPTPTPTPTPTPGP